MKKNSLMLSLLLGIAALNAEVPHFTGGKTTFKRQDSPTSFRAKAADLSMALGYCSDPYTAFYYPQGEIKVAMILTEEMINEYAGAQITGVQVANPTTNDLTNYLREATVWLSESLDSEPFVYGKGELSEVGLGWSSISLDEPYTIKEGTSLCVGYTLDVPESIEGNPLFSIVCDFTYPKNNNSAWLYSKFQDFTDSGEMIFSDEPSWVGVSYHFGNLCIRAIISGNMLEVNDVSLEDVTIPMAVEPGEPFDMQVKVKNKASNKVNDVEITMAIEGQENQVVNVSLEQPIGYKESSDETISFVCDRTGNSIPYSIYVSAINGNPVNLDNVYNGYILSINEGYKRNLVFEEATGLWCGYCVVGYAGMEYMKENYADKGFIGIALHENDPMSVLDYGEVYGDMLQYIDGFPKAFINRDLGNALYPSPETLEEEFKRLIDVPAFATISASVDVDEADPTKVTLSTSSQFITDELDAAYGIAYTVVEDKVGPYPQVNYLSGKDEEESYGFGNRPDPVLLAFNDVARNCSRPMPIEGSLPAIIEAGNKYDNTFGITLSDVFNQDNYRIVAMVVNGKTGKIENACEVSPVRTGVESVADDVNIYVQDGVLNAPADAVIYSIDGRRADRNNLTSGIYMVNTANSITKIIVR